ncbi:hypothetical protein Tco_0574412 [Tanacetum coccineum]
MVLASRRCIACALEARIGVRYDPFVMGPRDGEGAAVWKSTAGRTMELRAGAKPEMKLNKHSSSEEADVAKWILGLNARGLSVMMARAPSKRGLSTSTEEETPDASPTLAAKEVTETPPPNVEATSDSSAPVTHAAQSPPQTGPKAFEGMPVDQLMGEFDMVTAQQAALVAQLRARFANERSRIMQKDEEILLLRTQLADAQAEAESARSYAQNLAEEKMALLVKVEQERADAAMEGLLEKQEEKLRKLSIEYDEELYPHMLSTIAERRWLISHGLRLAAMSTLESAGGQVVLGDFEKCVLARDCELDQDYPIGVRMTRVNLAKAMPTRGAEAPHDYFQKPDVSQLQAGMANRYIEDLSLKGRNGVWEVEKSN